MSYGSKRQIASSSLEYFILSDVEVLIAIGKKTKFARIYRENVFYPRLGWPFNNVIFVLLNRWRWLYFYGQFYFNKLTRDVIGDFDS